MKKKNLIFIFIDGLGIGNRNQYNPLYGNSLRALPRLLQEAKALDARLGVPGTPQSATGQTSLFCGLNAQALVGRHIVGFPPPSLTKIIIKNNLFKQLADQGLRSTFANGYWLEDVGNLDRRSRKKISVTTVAAMHGIGEIRAAGALREGRAVYQDITQESLVRKGARLPVITEHEAAHRLIRIARDYDLTLFEYFQTDLAAHALDPMQASRVLSTLDAFLCALMDEINFSATALLLCSDHGNVEDPSTSSHTLNPVPYVALGPESPALTDGVRSIDGVVPAILRWFGVTR